MRCIVERTMGASAKTVSVSEKIRDAPMTFTEEDPAVSVEVSTTAVASLNDAAHSTTSPAQTVKRFWQRRPLEARQLRFPPPQSNPPY
jgi:hypothetical protein